MSRNIDVQQRVEQHYDFVCSQYNEDHILGVFLYGSQNYDLDCFNSDVDTKAIYVPSLEELVFDKPVSKQLDLPNGEHCEIKDIREYVNNLYKQNINFVEVLFTEYFVLNPKFEKIWKRDFIAHREDLARYDVHKAIHSMSHQASHTLQQAENGTNPCKKLSNVGRLIYFIQRYINGEDYLTCIKPTGADHDRLYDLKYNPRIVAAYETTTEMFKMILDYYKQANYEFLNHKDTQEWLDKIIKESILEMIHLNF